MKKERFTLAEIEVIEFKKDDVIVTSDEYEGENPEGGGNGYIHPSIF